MKHGMQVGLSHGHTVLDGELPHGKGHSNPHIRNLRAPYNPRSMSIVAQRLAGWIKIKLGMEVGLGLRQFVLNGDPAALP